LEDGVNPRPQSLNGKSNRRSVLKGAALGAGAVSAGLLANSVVLGSAGAATALNTGDVAILRLLAAIETIETDIWQQYNELGGIQDAEVPGGSGNPAYTADLLVLDADMSQYIHDNTEDEISHMNFLNAFLAANGATPVNLDPFRTLPSSKATGAQNIGRLTNLMKLTINTSFWTRYRSRTGNPDAPFNTTFPVAVPGLNVGQHPAIPRTNADLAPAKHLQAIANTAGFHFAWIEQGGTSLYATLAQGTSDLVVLRVVLSLGGTEIMHFQTWSDKAGNAPPLTDPVTGLVFPDLNAPPFDTQVFQTNLIMPEPTVFLNANLPKVSIIRPTQLGSGGTGGAVATVKAFTNDGLFIGQSPAFFTFLNQLAADADQARRQV
jgi:hypothetical protein